jgi:hypothetical protein
MDRPQARRVVERQCFGVLLPGSSSRSTTPNWPAVRSPTFWQIPTASRAPPWPIPLRESSTAFAKRASCVGRPDGHPWVHSYAHGRTVYELRFDAGAARAALEKASKEEAADTFIDFVLAGDLDLAEIEKLRDIASSRSGIGKRVLDTTLKLARQEQVDHQAQESRERRIAERRDPRPQIRAPLADAPWLPEMQVLNDVRGKSTDIEPPMRDVSGYIVQVRIRRVPKMHLLTVRGSNQCDSEETRLPAPEQPLLIRLDEIGVAELIEHHIEYVDAETSRPVHLGAPFVKHFLRRDDNALPIATGVATLPIVLPDGALLSGIGLDRDRGIVFRVAHELEAILPQPQGCNPVAVAEAMRYLTDDWLCDLASDYVGKCVVIACALTILERLLLAERPAFFVTAGQRRGGKTTTVQMIALAVLGIRAAAAVWSSSEEERRKALFPIFAKGCLSCPGTTCRVVRRYRARQSRSRSPPRLTATASWENQRLGRLRPIPFKFSRAITLHRGVTSPRARFACGSQSIGRIRRTGRSPTPTRSLGPKRTAVPSCGHSIQFCSAIRAYTTATASKPPRASRRGGT